MNGENRAIYLLKGIACIYVIFIHHRFPTPFNHYILGIGRAAVPFFFMVSGYYFYNGKNKKLKVVAHKVLYFIKLGSAMVVIYAFKSIVEETLLNGGSLGDLIMKQLNIKKIVYFLFLNETPFSGMAWYLFAAAYVYMVAWAMYSIKNVLYVLTPFLLCGHLYFNYLGFDVHYYMNWIFFGIPCFMIGAFIRDFQRIFERISALAILGAFLSAYVLAVAEMYINDSKELYVGSLIIAIMALVWAMKRPNYSGGKILQRIGKELSPYIYVFQSLVFWCVFKILYRINYPVKEYLSPIIGALCTIGFCFYFYVWFAIPLKRRKSKYHE